MDRSSSVKNEIKALNFETFLKRGFRFDNRLRRPRKRDLLNLIDFENGVKHKFLSNGENQMSEIRDQLIKAIELIIQNQSLDELNKKALLDLHPDIKKAKSSTNINKIIESGLYFTQEHK